PAKGICGVEVGAVPIAEAQLGHQPAPRSLHVAARVPAAVGKRGGERGYPRTLHNEALAIAQPDFLHGLDRRTDWRGSSLRVAWLAADEFHDQLCDDWSLDLSTAHAQLDAARYLADLDRSARWLDQLHLGCAALRLAQRQGQAQHDWSVGLHS